MDMIIQGKKFLVHGARKNALRSDKRKKYHNLSKEDIVYFRE